jgi:DNA-directed RNA polymerase specialized sigma24 family protein
LKLSDDGAVDSLVEGDSTVKDVHETERLEQLDRLDDEELTAIFVGDKQAFVVLYRRYVTRMYSYFAWRFGQNHAEDLTADVFTRALAARSGFK